MPVVQVVQSEQSMRMNYVLAIGILALPGFPAVDAPREEHPRACEVEETQFEGWKAEQMSNEWGDRSPQRGRGGNRSWH